MIRKFVVLVILLTFFLVSAQTAFAQFGQVKIFPKGKIKLAVAYDFRYGIDEIGAVYKFPQALDVLTGNFFGYGVVGTLLIVEGRYLHASSGRPNRPVIAEDWSGEIIITTEAKATQQRKNYRIAVEAGPFLIVEGKNYNNWDFRDNSFFRRTSRVGVGVLENGDFFLVKDFGSLEEFRFNTVAFLPRRQIIYFMNLDGGSSACYYNRLPTRLVILPR